MKKTGLITLLLMTYQISFACLSGQKITTAEALKTSDIVFIGEVISSEEIIIDAEDYWIETRYQFKVMMVVQGEIKTEIIYIHTDNTNYGFPFKVGQKYMVYADWHLIKKDNKKQQILFTDICYRTTEHYRDEIQLIRETEKRF
jgi:hypothetical protein